jgi:hypothetical protein
MKRLLFVVILITAFVCVKQILVNTDTQVTDPVVSPAASPTPKLLVTPKSPTATPTRKPTATPTPKSVYIDGLSFSAQAPFGDWKDPIQQDGCEEASVLTAVYWAQGKSFTKAEALELIKKISAYEIEKYGSSRDTSAEDTENRLIRGYFNYANSQVKIVNNINDIITWLHSGNLVIVPANGQKMNNPNFTAPGPDRHMVVIRGYDVARDEFITNDVGTRQGENYHYPSSILFSAIRDYPTGDHLPIENVSKNAILVWK